jgi:hypothetical protein
LGFCTGLGPMMLGGMSKYRPWYSTGSGPQTAFSASIASSAIRPRCLNGTLLTSHSSSDQASPTPSVIRPLLSWSIVATRRPSMTGL